MHSFNVAADIQGKMNSQKKKDEKKITNIDMVLFAWTNYVHVHWASGKILFIKGNTREGTHGHALILWIKLEERMRITLKNGPAPMLEVVHPTNGVHLTFAALY